MTSDARPATASQDSLAADTAMDAVTLHVEDLPGMTAYYRDALALSVLAEGPGGVTLGRVGRPLVVLRHTPGLPRPRRGEAGLFHTALLFEDPASLSAAVATAARMAPERYVGSADHLVSLAFYFTDPEGNGIELYTDRPRADWQWVDGELQMASLPLDPNRYLTTHLTEQALARPQAAPATVGHVHLQVGDIDVARRFYVDALGFEPTTALYPGALFVAAGGYHHHLAVNTWNSRGAGPRASSLGLGEVAVVVPDAQEVAALKDRLTHHRITAEDDGAGLTFDDPWHNRIRVTAQHAA